MNEKELQALVNLLDDPNNEIFEVIQPRLLNQGTEIIPFLEKAWENSFNELFQQRIEDIIQKIQFSNTSNALSNWANTQSDNLLEGAYLIAKYQYPDIDYDDILKKIDIIKQDIWLELNENLTALEKIKIINHILFEIHGFRRNSTNFYSPQNYYINNVLETKKGNPISLSIIYAVIAHKLNLPIYGINLPKNFILAYKDELVAKHAFEDDNDEGVLFYINPYNKGAVFGKREIDFFIKQYKLEYQKSYFTPCSNKEIIKRLIINLIETYKNLGYPNKITDLEILKKKLD
ncbi:MAG: transglutaminase family protein [Bacteroidales bacterium]|nr:transglutaminase family protein [Bacteroidales bacterium]